MSARLRISGSDYEALNAHLFPGDRDEHAAILLAGVAGSSSSPLLLAREVHLLGAEDFVPGRFGYRQFTPSALARLGNRANGEQLALISAHSHPGSGARVRLSEDDLAGHRKIFPHLLDIVGNGNAVGGIAFGSDGAAGEIWVNRDRRIDLELVEVLGASRLGLKPEPTRGKSHEQRFDRQGRLFGPEGQDRLRQMTVAIVGLGGGGSIISQQLAHLGVGKIVAFDFDRIETHNLSRIVGASVTDARRRRKKVDVARRLCRRIDRSVKFEAIDGDITEAKAAKRLSDCDFIFLCTDTITSRLIANATAQAYLIPMIQIGAKIDRAGDRIESVYSAVRPSFPRDGCLACAGVIDPVLLQKEAATDEEREAQNYLNLKEVVDPSVITLNSVAAASATNLMLMSTVGMATQEQTAHRIFNAGTGEWLVLKGDVDPDCLWCGREPQSRFGRGDGARLPVRLSTAQADGNALQRVVRRVRKRMAR
jgi:tRNA A37 threonylcarbamoyladenosine dehydratase